jgi:hypothetical protein
MAVGTVFVAGLAAGRFRMGFGRTFAERRRLPLAGAESLFELPGQFGILGFECGDAFREFAASGECGFVHPAMLAAQNRFSCTSSR